MFHTFWPLTTHSSPSRTARVARPARSEPAPGSENSWHHTLLAGEHRAQRSALAQLVAAVGDDRRRRRGPVEERRRVGGRGARASRSRLLDVALQLRPRRRARRSPRGSAPTPGPRRSAPPERDVVGRLGIVRGQERVERLFDLPGLGIGTPCRRARLGHRHGTSVPEPPPTHQPSDEPTDRGVGRSLIATTGDA